MGSDAQGKASSQRTYLVAAILALALVGGSLLFSLSSCQSTPSRKVERPSDSSLAPSSTSPSTYDAEALETRVVESRARDGVGVGIPVLLPVGLAPEWAIVEAGLDPSRQVWRMKLLNRSNGDTVEVVQQATSVKALVASEGVEKGLESVDLSTWQLGMWDSYQTKSDDFLIVSRAGKRSAVGVRAQSVDKAIEVAKSLISFDTGKPQVLD